MEGGVSVVWIEAENLNTPSKHTRLKISQAASFLSMVKVTSQKLTAGAVLLAKTLAGRLETGQESFATLLGLLAPAQHCKKKPHTVWKVSNRTTTFNVESLREVMRGRVKV